jgi:hypothetical protein
MKKLLIALLLMAPSLATTQVLKGYNDYVREQQEQEMRQLQIERMKQGLAPDPEIDRQLRASGQRECRVERYRINGEITKCKVCPGDRGETRTNCTTY